MGTMPTVHTKNLGVMSKPVQKLMHFNGAGIWQLFTHLGGTIVFHPFGYHEIQLFSD